MFHIVDVDNTLVFTDQLNTAGYVYALVSFAQDKWRYFEGKHGNIWDLPIAVDPEATQPTLTEWLTNYTPKFSTIDEYKQALVSWMSYVFH